MNGEKSTPVFRKNYEIFDYTIDQLELKFELHEESTIVTATSRFIKNALSKKDVPPLVLFGEGLELVSIKVDNDDLDPSCYQIDDKTLIIKNSSVAFTLEIVTRIFPDSNTLLEGLYRSNGIYCTQCEAEGFRKITYYPDRPDVLTKFSCRIEADQKVCPVLLSNGNLIETGTLDAKRHYAVWHDPFPKPSYLFALIAGKLVHLQDEFITKSGGIIDLKIFTEARNQEKCQHAMESLKKAMRWDEDVFGLEYDLDNFMIVAVDDFNMGAMENKGLNIFNAKYVLASQETATDQDYLGIEGVIAHEYFHNWTGNRVTCRDWFQLSLKEGLTVFRDQEFSSDMNSQAVQRIDDVRVLKNFQFKEDAGPMAHPVRPDSYLEINNFYTATVYNKGAEVIRMLQTIVGKEKFRQGMDLYFARHDGQAVTCEDFVAAMSDASGVDLEQFKRWYSQAGTPVLEVAGDWDEVESEYRLTVRQILPDTPTKTAKDPYHIPLVVDLLGSNGTTLLAYHNVDAPVLQLRDIEQTFSFSNVTEKPVVSFLRDFSAPVKVAQFQTREELAFLMRYDTNLFNRWDAGNRLASEVILEITGMINNGFPPSIDTLFLDAMAYSLQHNLTDAALLALTLALPQETTLAQDMAVITPDSLHNSRQLVKKEVAKQNQAIFEKLYYSNQEEGGFTISSEAMGRRSLKNVALSYLMSIDPLPKDILLLCYKQYQSATNMTDCVAALGQLVNIDNALRQEALDDFYNDWVEDPLVLDKWFGLQAMSILPNTLDNVRLLTCNPSFSLANPNKVRSLIGAFASSNHVRFHTSNGEGYCFLADKIIELNVINPQIAARLVTPLINWRRYDPSRQKLMLEQLDRIAAIKDLSRDVFEIIDKSR